MRIFRLAMVQMNPTVGDLDGNVREICRWLKEARKTKVDAVAFPELAVTGYPPEDLLLKPRFLEETGRAVDQIIKESRDCVVVVGTVASRRDGEIVCSGAISPDPNRLVNAAAIISNRRIVGTYAKGYLPNYGVFDERRYFQPGDKIPVFVINGAVVGVNICEDIWFPEGPTRAQALKGGAEIILNINASPFQVGKSRGREEMLATRARDNRVIVSYTNTVGGQDELVFDGNSLIIDQDGEVVHRGQAFKEELLIADLNIDAVRRSRGLLTSKDQPTKRSPRVVEKIVIPHSYHSKSRSRLMGSSARSLTPLEEVYGALVLGVRDYVKKNGFKKVLIGLSGGIDSTLTAVIACDAVGASNVVGVLMPSPYTSRESKEDAKELAEGLRMTLLTIPITRLFHSYLRVLSKTFSGAQPDTTEENLQARIRGNLLMALSNKFGHLVLTTGNKSEMSVGYATLYGDMAGGFAVIKDVPKTLVFELAGWRNSVKESGYDAVSIPKRIQVRAPSAELKAHQTDQDTLPPYPVLDAILKGYVEEDRSPAEIAELGFDPKVVNRVVTMVDRSEYKRRQAPIGIKITPRALGKDRRMPITNRYPHS